MIKAVGETLHGVPILMVPGLVVFAMSSAADVAFHAAPFGWGEVMESYLGGEGYLAHLGIVSGMILTILGLVLWEIAGRRGNRRPRPRRIVRGV